jgi:hypothetical protein
LCSGALIGPKHVLTTASCVYKFESSRDAASWDHPADFSYSGLTVNIAGDSSSSGDNVTHIHVHPSAAFDMEVLRVGFVGVPCAQGVMVVFCVRVRGGAGALAQVCTFLCMCSVYGEALLLRTCDPEWATNLSVSLSLLPFSCSLSHSLCQFDMAIVELHENSTSNVKPAQLYDGGDLGISDCKKMTLSYLSWASIGGVTTDADFSPQMTKVQLTDHKSCQVRVGTPHTFHLCDGDESCCVARQINRMS